MTPNVQHLGMSLKVLHLRMDYVMTHLRINLKTPHLGVSWKVSSHLEVATNMLYHGMRTKVLHLTLKIIVLHLRMETKVIMWDLKMRQNNHPSFGLLFWFLTVNSSTADYCFTKVVKFNAALGVCGLRYSHCLLVTRHLECSKLECSFGCWQSLLFRLSSCIIIPFYIHLKLCYHVFGEFRTVLSFLLGCEGQVSHCLMADLAKCCDQMV